MNHNRNIVFLDVDGVLNSMAYFENQKLTPKKEAFSELSDFHLQMLSQIVHSCDALIVLTSTWRDLQGSRCQKAEKMYQYLIDSLKKYDMSVFDKVSYIRNNRPLEIVTWLEDQPDRDSIHFVSLDDDFSKEEYEVYGIADHLVQTRFFCSDLSEGGLQQSHVNQAIAILKEGDWL